jgi:uncharacterized ferredoxin-like protein
MPILDSLEQERQGIMQTANLMVVAARTAPKSGGRDDILAAIVYGPELEALVADMEKIGTERNGERWRQQAQNVRAAQVIVLLGVRGTKSYITNCGACGYESCEAFDKAKKKRGQDFLGPTCIFKALDLGIALCSAVKTASILNADNRIFYRIGVAAQRLRYLPEASIIMGIPLSAKGKNPYFDREGR